MKKKPILLSVCADDYGITDNVNNSIIKLIDNNRITETSCIVLTNNFEKNLKELIKRKQKIDIGLHLTLTNFLPLTKFNILKKNNKLPSITLLFLYLLFHKKILNIIKKEIDSQYNKFVKCFGFKPDFIDGHHHVHQFPHMGKLILLLIKKNYNKDEYPWVRLSSDKLYKIIYRKNSIIKAIFISLFSNNIKKNMIKDIKFNIGFSGFYNFSNEYNYEKRFPNFLNNIVSGHLLMVHPGINDKKLLSIDKATISREKEYKFLMSDKYLDILNKKNIKLQKLSKTINN